MLYIGLDLGTGFVKCVSDFGAVRFPSLYASRIPGKWSDSITEVVGDGAVKIKNSRGTSLVRPIKRGRPDKNYQKQLELLIKEAIDQTYRLAKIPAGTKQENRIVIGLPYYAYDDKELIKKLVTKSVHATKCIPVAQTIGTMLDMDKKSGIVVSIGQGTTEIIVVDNYEVIDGESSHWASDFITQKIDKYAHLDVNQLQAHKELCKKYAKNLAENLSQDIIEVCEEYNNQYEILLSGGGILIPGVKDNLLSRLQKYKVIIPEDPVMSNAKGLYKLAKNN